MITIKDLIVHRRRSVQLDDPAEQGGVHDSGDRDPEQGIQAQDTPDRPVMAGPEHQRRRRDRDQDVGLGGEIAEKRTSNVRWPGS